MFVVDRLYAVESARLVAEQENEDLHRELDVVNTRVRLLYKVTDFVSCSEIFLRINNYVVFLLPQSHQFC